MLEFDPYQPLQPAPVLNRRPWWSRWRSTASWHPAVSRPLLARLKAELDLAIVIVRSPEQLRNVKSRR